MWFIDLWDHHLEQSALEGTGVWIPNLLSPHKGLWNNSTTTKNWISVTFQLSEQKQNSFPRMACGGFPWLGSSRKIMIKINILLQREEVCWIISRSDAVLCFQLSCAWKSPRGHNLPCCQIINLSCVVVFFCLKCCPCNNSSEDAIG